MATRNRGAKGPPKSTGAAAGGDWLAGDAPRKAARGITLWTVGHSTRPIADFVGLLQAHGIRQLVDVRTIPRSWHNPQFNQDQLPGPLKKAGIQYVHMAGLGGLRRTNRDSVNTAWRNASFRGFADYMQTDEFDAALEDLIRLAARKPTAIMCAEAVPWRCHRSLIADALVARGISVEEIIGNSSVRLHVLTPWARVIGKRVTYPGEPDGVSDQPDRKPGKAKGPKPTRSNAEPRRRARKATAK